MRQKAIDLLQTLPAETLELFAQVIYNTRIEGDWGWDGEDSVMMDDIQLTLNSLAIGIRDPESKFCKYCKYRIQLKNYPEVVREAFAVYVETADVQGGFDYGSDVSEALDTIGDAVLCGDIR